MGCVAGDWIQFLPLGWLVGIGTTRAMRRGYMPHEARSELVVVLVPIVVFMARLWGRTVDSESALGALVVLKRRIVQGA